MEVTVNGKHFELTEPIHDYAVEKANKLPKFYDRVHQVDILIDKTDSHTFGCEFIAHVEGADHFVANGKNADLYAAIDETSGKIERQLHKYKEIKRNHKHH